ncbi:hypothetical protein BDV26DRAFT_293253 [Aspergillus bertholletiae]|uniref:NWD NACHT-NTPase N-terminal domain-containing protein n=1 Tax=Aspergillus bertholletiae TaxID=1226010 RepID=A0A5N7B782_9EURO|nr:hypothetical protein BDV26DRAFT_293253 [Aspergillus bertholletiae]
MKFFCCSTGDHNDEVDQPPRPTRVPDKVPPVESASSGANTSAPVIPPTSSRDVSLAHEKPDKCDRPDLWKEAFDSLDEDRQKLVSQGQAGSTTDAINGVIDQTRGKYTEWQKNGPKVKRKDGDEINVRDVTERILNAALQAKDLIANITAFDPTGKASAAWTVVSLGLTMVSNNIESRDAMFASSEYLAENLAYYALVDTHYRDHQVDGGQNFDRALIRVYTAILGYTAEVYKVKQESTFS